ncbi:MAG: Mut7-C ubiquitin/RNAse domain-containing protein [Candidatus Eisenbacteria bacterium]|nr:Mut7-C ubiquitin/RNAse domain-containing protein [Candidatus Eisenbacteria bacterium]
MAREHEAEFRFYEELNDFLPPERRRRAIAYSFSGSPSIKDAIEALGVPHTEVDLIIANGASAGFGYRLQPGDRIAVYPVFESFDIAPITRLQDRPLRRTRFILDVHLGTLARLLRWLGFDALYENHWTDREIVRLSTSEQRAILTRDRGLLMIASVTHGYWVRSSDPDEQAREVLVRFDLAHQAHPFTRCPACNAPIETVAKEEVLERLEPKTKQYYEEFRRCAGCGRVYWKGSHFEKIRARLERILRLAGEGSS